MFFSPAFAANRGTSLINELSNLGLLTNLKLCLDAGDPNSYAGSGQTWFDLSGNGNHFYRGSGSGSDGADPTFNAVGNGGTYRDYFSFDGGDYFTKATANDTFFNSLHKDSAAFTLATLFYFTGNAGGWVDFGDSFFSGSPGFQIGANGSFKIFIAIYDAAGGLSGSVVTTAVLTPGAWHYIAVSWDEPSGAVVTQINGSQDTFSGKTYSSPSSANAGGPFQLGASGNGSNIEANGNRIASVAMWGRALSAAELSSLYTANKSRFGLA